jgi:hypothetical protein
VDPFDHLLSQMPAIAEAVNGFTSEQVQQQAFRALISAIGGEVTDTDDSDMEADAGTGASPEARASTRRRPRPKKAPAAADGEAATGTPARRRSVVAGPSHDKNLDLYPKGAESFADFVESKKPTTIQERNLVAVYYLTRIAGVKATVDAVYTAYKDRKWKVPTDLRNALQVTASVKGWLNTENSDDLKVAIPGENYVEHDLPKAAKA